MNRENALAVLRQFKREHGDEYKLTALGLFGSVARDAATDKSDVDIVFKTDAPNLFRTSRMRQELERLMGRRVDVIRFRERMNPHLKARIEAEARYV